MNIVYHSHIEEPLYLSFLHYMYIDCFFSRPTDNIGFSYVRRKLNSCLFKQSVSTHNVKLAEMRAIYDKVTTALVFFIILYVVANAFMSGLGKHKNSISIHYFCMV